MTRLLIILELILIFLCGFVAIADYITGNIFGGICYTFCTVCWIACVTLNIKEYINERNR